MRFKGEIDPRDRQTQKRTVRNGDETQRIDRPDRQTDRLRNTQRETEMRLKG